MRKIILKGEEMTKEELEEFALGAAQKEITNELSRMSPAELFLLSDVFQNQDTTKAHNVVDFIRFVRSFCRFLSDENAEELGDYTTDAIESILDDKVRKELIASILKTESDDYGD